MSIETWHKANKPHMGLGQLEYFTNFLPDRSALYIETPKVACSTVKATLHAIATGEKSTDTFAGIHQRRRSPLPSFQEVENIEDELARTDQFRFCFVRNPYTRTLSAYRDKIQGGDTKMRRAIYKALKLPEGHQDVIPFEQFLEVVEAQRPKQMNPHYRVQYYQTMQGLIPYDFVGRFETFAADFASVLDKISADTGGNTADMIQTIRPHSTASDDTAIAALSAREKALIQKIYALDFEHFGYSA